MARVTDKITHLIEPVIEGMGYELLGIEYVASGKHSILRIFIDINKSISVNDCEIVSRQLSSIFDIEEPISGQYNLEVSSPGIERPLFHKGHYQRFLGFNVKLHMFRPISGQSNFFGVIGSVSEINNTIELVGESGAIILDIDLIKKANLVVDF